MQHKDYSRKEILYEAFIDIMFLPNEKQEYSEIVTMWIGDFEAIMDLIPLNDEGMFDALAFHYQVDTPWEEREDEPWEVDELELSLTQLLDAKHLLYEKGKIEDQLTLFNICSDICEIIQKAQNKQGKAFIKYYY